MLCRRFCSANHETGICSLWCSVLLGTCWSLCYGGECRPSSTNPGCGRLANCYGGEWCKNATDGYCLPCDFPFIKPRKQDCLSLGVSYQSSGIDRRRTLTDAQVGNGDDCSYYCCCEESEESGIGSLSWWQIGLIIGSIVLLIGTVGGIIFRRHMGNQQQHHQQPPVIIGAPAPVVNEAQAPPANATGTSFCTSCGRQRAMGNEKFCPGCGFKFPTSN